MSQSSTVSVVVAEHGSDWTPWLSRFRMAHAPVEVIAQEPEERLHDFAARVRSRVGELLRDAIRVKRAVIAGAGRSDREALASRSLSIRALASAMAEDGGGELLLDDAGADRFSMQALAFTVAEMVRGTGVVVTADAAAPVYAQVA